MPFEGLSDIVGTTTARKATATRRTIARVFILDDVKREQNRIKRKDEFACLKVESTFRYPFMHKDSFP